MSKWGEDPERFTGGIKVNTPALAFVVLAFAFFLLALHAMGFTLE